MAQFRSVLTLDAELTKFCSVFDSLPQASLLFDSDRTVLYTNKAFDLHYSSKVELAKELEHHFPDLDKVLISFLETNTLYHEEGLNGQIVSFRRFVSSENEYVLYLLFELSYGTEKLCEKVSF